MICDRFAFLHVDTISDLFHNATIVLRIPVNVILKLMEEGNPKISHFFEIDCTIGTGLGSLLASLLIWFFLFVLVASVMSSFEK